MPTLLEKLPLAPAPEVPLSDLLRQRHRWEYWRGILFTLLAGLGATFLALWAFHFYGQTPGNGKIVAAIWAGGILLTILATLVGWRFAPSSLLDTAQQLDRDLTAKNRLEATAALHGSTSFLAQAQREETAAYLSRQPPVAVRPVRTLPWLVGAVLLLILAHLVTVGLWVIPMLIQHPAAPITPPPKPPTPTIPKASILWQSPEPESKANPIEEVPTVAIAQSTSGLKNLSLEISVNGMPKMSIPLAATPFDKPGKNTLKSSLYMDELGVEPFDVVTYYIRAQRITEQKLPDTTSAIQFIQVRPFRDDVEQARGAEAISKGQALLIKLKLAQLRSIKENFILVHTDLPVTDPVRIKENDRVGKNQGELSAKTQEVVQAFVQEGVSPDIIDLLSQAAPPMDDAAKKILANENSQALRPQQKALSFIVQVEKFFRRYMADKSISHGPAGPDDPFKDKQQHELKKRMALASGQLETLARNQTKLSNDLNHPDAQNDGNFPSADAPDPTANPQPGTSGTNPDGSQKEIPLPPTQAVDPFRPDADKGAFAERQARVVQGIEALLNGNKVLPQAVVDALQEAQKDAITSMRELDQPDEAGAREPAANAAQDLQKAVAEMIKAGEQETKVAMEAGQQKLNDLAQQLRNLAENGSPDAQQKMADLARQIQDLKKHLEDAADKQQESGTAAGAERLNHLAKGISDQKVAPDLANMAKTGLDANKAATDADKLDALASQAAQGVMPGKSSAQDIANLINSLERSRANLVRLAQQAGVSPPTSAGKDQGQEPGQGLTRSDSSGQGQGQSTSQASGSEGRGIPNEAAAANNPANPNSKQSPAVLAQAYREVLADLKNEAEMANVAVPQAHSGELMQAVTNAGHGANDPPPHLTIPVIVNGGFPGIVGPLDQLIIEMKQAMAQAQRNEVVKQPNLDEAPPSYRSAVSDYFEGMSKDYHPDSGDQDTKKP